MTVEARFQAVSRVVCVGEVMIEMTSNGPDHAKLGVAGDTYNTAVYLARLLGRDVGVSYATALGVDRFSDRILAQMAKNGVDTSFVERRTDKMPGLYAIETDDQGERSFAYWRSDSAARTLFAEPCTITFDSLTAFDLIYLSGITLAILPDETRRNLFSFLAAFRANGGLVAYDSNYRPRLWADQATAQTVNQEMYGLADLALPSFDDETALFGDANPETVVRRLTEAGVGLGAVTYGPNELSPIPTTTPIPHLEVAKHVVDTTAAGDSFNAGVMAALIQGHSLTEALSQGHALAVKVLGYEGAICPA